LAADFRIRAATAADAPGLLDIYRPFVEGTAISFELTTPTVDEIASRIAKTLAQWQWLVAERDGSCAGYAYSPRGATATRSPA
jgi:phosphinothricin acetyltransferase